MSLKSRRPPRSDRATPVPACDPDAEHAKHLMPGSTPNDVFLDDRQFAARWNCSPKTLRNHRSAKIGCGFVRIGRLVRYRLSDIINFEG